jgi:RNA polymerase sigma-70 factor (ECF subfamily)
MSEKLHGDILACLPQLSAFARRLARDRATADDLVQSAIVRALVHADQFQPGTNFRAWITTILRNAYLNELRARDYRATVDTDVDACAPPSHGGQEERLRFRDVRRALSQLPAGQRRALLLVGAEGRSYEEAARVTGCAVGTVKSRVSRARVQLQEMLDARDASGEEQRALSH